MGATRQNEDTEEKRALGEALQRSKSATHARVTANGTASIVALPGGKNRRSASVALLERVGWDRIELVDKSGSVVDVVTLQGEVVTEVVREPDDPADRRVLAIVAVIERATDVALARRESEFKALLAGVTSILGSQSHAMSSVTQAMDALAAAYRESGDAREQSARQLAESASAGDGDPIRAISELAPHIPALVAMARSFGIGAYTIQPPPVKP